MFEVFGQRSLGDCKQQSSVWIHILCMNSVEQQFDGEGDVHSVSQQCDTGNNRLHDDQLWIWFLEAYCVFFQLQDLGETDHSGHHVEQHAHQTEAGHESVKRQEASAGTVTQNDHKCDETQEEADAVGHRRDPYLPVTYLRQTVGHLYHQGHHLTSSPQLENL